MQVFSGSGALDRELRHPVLTIGNFDGLHVGHRAIMRTVIARARALDGEAVMYTFDPHPRKILQPERAPGLLTTMEHLRRTPEPTRQEIRAALVNNMCRCTGYLQIVEAVEDAARRMRAGAD